MMIHPCSRQDNTHSLSGQKPDRLIKKFRFPFSLQYAVQIDCPYQSSSTIFPVSYFGMKVMKPSPKGICSLYLGFGSFQFFQATLCKRVSFQILISQLKLTFLQLPSQFRLQRKPLLYITASNTIRRLRSGFLVCIMPLNQPFAQVRRTGIRISLCKISFFLTQMRIKLVITY